MRNQKKLNKQIYFVTDGLSCVEAGAKGGLGWAALDLAGAGKLDNVHQLWELQDKDSTNIAMFDTNRKAKVSSFARSWSDVENYTFSNVNIKNMKRFAKSWNRGVPEPREALMQDGVSGLSSINEGQGFADWLGSLKGTKGDALIEINGETFLG